MTSNAYFGWVNHVTTGALSAGASAQSLPVSNLSLLQGAPSLGWQTPAGTTTSWMQIDSGSDLSTWRTFLLARTNLSTVAFIRWRVGSADALVELFPALAFDVTGGSTVTPAGWTFSRASPAYAFNSAGNLVQSANDVLRVDYDPSSLALRGALFEPAATNGIRNPRAEGAVVGSPGTGPTNWQLSGSTLGLTQTVAFGTVNGIPYLDLRYNGTSTGGQLSLFLEASTIIAALTGQTWTLSAYLQVVAGTLPTTLFFVIPEQTSGGANVVTNTSAAFTPASAGPLSVQRYSYTATLNGGATTAFIRPRMLINVPAGATDFTLRIGAPQMEMLGFASTPMLPAVNARTATPRAADLAAIAAAIPISWGIYADMTVTQGAAVAQPLAINPAGGYSATTSTFLQTFSGTAMQLIVGNGSGGTFGGSPTVIGPGSGTAFLTSFAFDAVGSIFAVGTATAATTGPLARPTLAAIAVGNTAAQVWVRRLAYYAPRPTDLQVRALASSGSSLNAAALTYDSRAVLAGVVPGYGQTVTILPADVIGRYCRVDIGDPSNPDGFLNVPLAFAGPAWNLAVGPNYASMIGRDDQTDEAVTRGGQEYPVLRWQRRRWELTFEGIQASEFVPNLLELDRISRSGGNVFFVLDALNGALNTDVVFGRLQSTKDIGYPGLGTAMRGWSARVTERI